MKSIETLWVLCDMLEEEDRQPTAILELEQDDVSPTSVSLEARPVLCVLLSRLSVIAGGEDTVLGVRAAMLINHTAQNLLATYDTWANTTTDSTVVTSSEGPGARQQLGIMEHAPAVAQRVMQRWETDTVRPLTDAPRGIFDGAGGIFGSSADDEDDNDT